MDIFDGGRLGEIFTLRLDQGEDVLGSIETAARDKDIHSGIVLSGIGTLDRARLHYVSDAGYHPAEQFVEYEGPIELVSVESIIAEHVPHLHTYISIEDKTYVGHLEPGCRVLYLAEIAIARLEGVRLCRRPHPDRDVNTLQLAE